MARGEARERADAERVAQLRGLAAEGLTAIGAAARIGVTASAIRSLAFRHGVVLVDGRHARKRPEPPKQGRKPDPRAWTPEQDCAAATALRTGGSRASAAVAIGRSRVALDSRINLWGSLGDYMDAHAPKPPAPKSPEPPKPDAAPIRLDAWGAEALRQSCGRLTRAEAAREGERMRARFARTEVR